MSALGRWLRRALLALLAVALVVTAAWLAGRERAARWLAAEVERALAAALHVPVRLEDPRLTLIPPGVAVARVSLGEEGGAARLRDLSARLQVAATVAQARPAVALSGADLYLDLTRFPASEDAETGVPAQQGAVAPRLPPFAVALTLDGAEVRLDELHRLALRGASATAAARRRQGLVLTLRGEAIRVAAGKRSVAVDTVDVAAGWRDGSWRIERAEVRGPALRVDVEGETEPLGHRVALTADLARLSELLPESWRARGALSADLALRGDLADPRGAATLHVDDASLAGVQATRVDLSARRDDGAVVVSALRLELAKGAVELRGEVREKKGLPVRATLRLESLDTEILAPLVGAIEHAAARVSGEIEVDGSLEPLGGKLNGRGTLSPAGGASWSWSAALEGDGDAGSLQLAAQREGGGKVVAKAQVGRRGALDGTAHADVADLAPLSELLAAVAPAPVLPTAGRAAIDVVLSGSLRRPAVEAVVSGNDIVLYGGDVEALEAQVRVDASALEVRRAKLRLPRGGVEASGVFALDGKTENDWRVQGVGVDSEWVLALLAELDVVPVIPASGPATASVGATGAWEALAIEGQAVIDDGALAGEPLRQVRADFATGGGSWKVDANARGEGDAQLRASLGGGAGGLTLAVRGAGWDLAALSALAGSGLGGTASLEANFSGPPGALDGVAQLRVDELNASGSAVGAVTATATARDGSWELEANALGDRLRVRASLAPLPDLPVRIDASVREVDAARLLGAPPDVSAVLSGVATASGPLRSPTALRGDAEITAARLAHGAESVEAERPIQLQWADGALQIEPFALAGSETRLRGRGRLAADGDLEASLSGQASLAWLEAALGPPLESADGELRFEVGLRRRPGAKPALSGELQMANGALDFGEALALSGIEGVFTFADDVVTVQSLAASTGGGRVTVTGTVGLDAGPNLKWRLNEVALAPMQALEVELRGSGHLRGAWDAVELGGDVKVVQLLYDRDLEFADLIPSFNRALRPARKRQAGRPPLRLDLHITATQSLFVENNIARLEAGADLHLRGTLRKPTLQGDVRIVDGVIRLRKREFEVLNGSLTFRPALGNVAAIDFKAESVVDTDEESYGVGIRVSGLTNDYRVRLTSTDGGLSQTDVASLITFGKTVSQLQRGGGEGGGVSLDTLVGLAGYNLGGRLADQAEEVLPFDQIEFRPQFSTTTGQFEPEVRVGKNLSEDLSAWIGQTFGVQSRTTVEAEYRLSARLASALLWESSTASEQGAIGGEARFRRDFWRFGQILFFGAGD